LYLNIPLLRATLWLPPFHLRYVIVLAMTMYAPSFQTTFFRESSTTKKPTQMLERAPKGLFSTRLAFELPVETTALGEQAMATPGVQCSP
jgi:hypothetical protein